MKKTFIAPKPSSFMYGLTKILGKPVIKILQNITEIYVNDADIAKVKKFGDERMIFFGNHPTTAEPPLVVHLANLLGDKFHFIGSRQIFEWGGGIMAYILPKFGAYSVIAGYADRASVSATREILAAKKARLVIFPEGEPTSGENDNLMPFQPGICQLGFWGLEDARKIDPKADIMVIPSFFRYVIDAPEKKIMETIEKRLRKLEKKLKINPEKKRIVHRLLTIGRVLLETFETKYKISPENNDDFNYRCGRVRHALLDDVADKYLPRGYDRKNDDGITKFRKLFPIAELMMIEHTEPSLPKLDNKTKKECLIDLIRAFDFIVIKRDYLIEKPTAERIFEWLDRYEFLVLGNKPRTLGGLPSVLPRKAYIEFGEIFPISKFYTQSKTDKKDAVAKMNTHLRSEMERLLEKSAHLNVPLTGVLDPEWEKK